MKLSSFVILLFCSTSFGQKIDTLHFHIFINGKVSTIATIVDQREGFALAFNFSGKEIYRQSIRRYAGVASVNFKHHKNGMVRVAEYSSHPDGGIQWYRSWTYFDEEGNFIREDKQDWDERVTIQPHFTPNDSIRIYVPPKRTEPVVQPPVKPFKQEVVECARIHQNHVEFVNHTRKSIMLLVQYQRTDSLSTLKSGKTHKGPTYISAEIHSPLAHNLQFKVFPKGKRKIIFDTVIETKKINENETLVLVHIYERQVKPK